MGQLANYTIDQVAGALALTLGSIGGLCLILFKSRCSHISICWGIWECNRKVVEEDTPEEVKKTDKTEEIIPKKIKPLTQTDSIGIPISSPEPEPEPNP
tara:strand:- start:1539 stop:1835 length:297 start_codon:yes stop_codon:yes gene_type:complete